MENKTNLFEYEFLLSDVDIPKIDGFKFYEQHIKNKIKIPTLFVSGKTSNISKLKEILDKHK